MSLPLSVKDLERLTFLKSKIEESLGIIASTWRETAVWAEEIKTKEYWRSESKSWSEFCVKQGWTARRFDQLIKSNTVLLAIEQKSRTSGSHSISERAARELAKITPEKAADVIDKLSYQGKPITSNNVAAEYEPTEPPEMSEVPKDKMGFPLTEEIIPLWNRGEEEILALVSHLSKSKKEIKDAHDKSDPLYHGFDCQGWVNDLSLVIHMLKCHRPYAVCPVCNGRLCKRCACCKGRGFVGKAYWEGPSVFVEMRTMREMQIAKASQA